jgi:Tfp pilus assembly protein PilV
MWVLSLQAFFLMNDMECTWRLTADAVAKQSMRQLPWWVQGEMVGVEHKSWALKPMFGEWCSFWLSNAILCSRESPTAVLPWSRWHLCLWGAAVEGRGQRGWEAQFCCSRSQPSVGCSSEICSSSGHLLQLWL